MVTICTTKFNAKNYDFFPHTVYLYVSYGSQTKQWLFLYTVSSDCLHDREEMCLLRGTKSLNIVQVNLSLKMVKNTSSVFTWRLKALWKLSPATSISGMYLSCHQPAKTFQPPHRTNVSSSTLYPELENSTLLWNLEAHQADYTVSQARRQQ